MLAIKKIIEVLEECKNFIKKIIDSTSTSS